MPIRSEGDVDNRAVLNLDRVPMRVGLTSLAGCSRTRYCSARRFPCRPSRQHSVRSSRHPRSWGAFCIAYQQKRSRLHPIETSGFTGEKYSCGWSEGIVTGTDRCAIASSRPSLTRSGPPWRWAERRLCLRHLAQNARRPERYDLQTDEYEAGPACPARKWRTAPSANSDIAA